MTPTDSYMLRLKQHLELLPAAERPAFVERQRQAWEARYYHFQELVMADETAPGTAFDYVSTIVSLDALAFKLRASGENPRL